MEDSSDSIPALHLRSPTIDFIDQRLPSHHPLFATPAHGAPPHALAGGSTALASRPLNQLSLAQSGPLTSPQVHAQVVDATGSTRPVWTDIKAMRFWNELFPEALAKFKSTVAEPKSQVNSKFSIRQENDWEAIFSKLEQSQSVYQEEAGGRRWFRKMRRKAADSVDVIAEGTRNLSMAIPDTVFSTPVVGVIQIILDAASTAANVRGQVLEGFDALIPTFSDIELFLGTFPEDAGVRGACVDLIGATLHAIERAIGFFTSNEVARGFKALGMGDQYASKLIQSLEDINNKSRKLMDEATKSHIHEFHTYSKDTRQFGQHMINGQERLATAMNAIGQLLIGHIHERDRLLAIEKERQRREMEASRQEIVFLRIENNRLRSVSPTDQGHLLPAPPSPRFSTDRLRWLIGSMEVDLADIASVLDIADALPWRQRAQVEQLIQTPKFRHWIMSPSSTKLLVHWDRRPPHQIANVSPLSAFVASLVQMLRRDDTRFISAVWFCALHTHSGSASPGGKEMVASILDQILRQHRFDLSGSPIESGQIDVQALQSRDISASLIILEWLIRQLPETVTLVFLVDGVAVYEQDEHQALDVFATLIRLVGDRTIRAAVKVMFTSTPGTDIVRAAFEGEDLIVNVEVLPQLGWAPSDERVARELGSLVE